LIDYDEREQVNYQYIVIEMDAAVTGIKRDVLVEVLHAENVLARRYFYPGCHRMEPYRSYFPHAGLLLPNTERLASRNVVLPTGTAVGSDDISRTCALIRLAAAHGKQIERRLVDKARARELVA
jgi:dTDP-4-amino-4,6-dideoxygalactose transaminase